MRAAVKGVITQQVQVLAEELMVTHCDLMRSEGVMFWFFERHGQSLRCEVRLAPEGPAFELRVRYPDTQTQVERIHDPGTLIERFKKTQGRLHDDGWTMAGSLDLQMPASAFAAKA